MSQNYPLEIWDLYYPNAAATGLPFGRSRIERKDIWPGPQDIGSVVLLPGGEAGILRTWWNAPDHSEWRWQVEFYNHR